MQLGPLLRAHAFMKTESPPELWDADTDDEAIIPLIGLAIAAALAKGAELADLTFAASNVVVLPDTDDEHAGDSPSPGEFVAVSIRGPGAWTADWSWTPHAPSRDRWAMEQEERMRRARVLYAYGRALAESSITMFLARRR